MASDTLTVVPQLYLLLLPPASCVVNGTLLLCRTMLDSSILSLVGCMGGDILYIPGHTAQLLTRSYNLIKNTGSTINVTFPLLSGTMRSNTALFNIGSP